MSAAADDLSRHEQLRSERAKEEPAWREIARLGRRDEQDFSGNEQTNRDDADGDIFDSTMIYAIDDFAGGLFGQGMNPTDRWFGIGVGGDPDLAEWKPVKTYRWQVANIAYASLAPTVSGFYMRAPAMLGAMGAFGFGTMYSEEDVGKERFTDRAIPPGETYLATDANGNYNEFDREFMLTGLQIKGLFGDSYRVTCRDDDKKVIVHRVHENPEYRKGALDWRGLPWRSVYCSPDLKDLRIEKGYHEMPYAIAGWNERMRSAYPTGPGHLARGDAWMADEMERIDLVGAQFENQPPLLLTDESAFTAADVAPMATLYGGMTEQGKRIAEWLEKKGSARTMEAKLEQRRAAIRMAFRFSMMQVANRPQMTLGEFSGWKEQELKLAAPNLVRVQTGGLAPFITRRIRILARAGQMPPLPRELVGKPMTIEFESPLARVQRMAQARGVLQAQEAVEKIAITDPTARDRFNGDNAVKHVVGAFSEAPDLLRDDEEVTKIRDARAAAQAEQRQIEQQAQKVETAAVAAHAVQAQTLSEGRAA